jgi:hypothetical protein
MPIGFEEDELDTDLTKAITQEYQSTVSDGNAAGQAAPTEELAAGVTTTFKHRLQISKLLMGKKKLLVSNGRQTLRSRLTILLLQQNLVHGDQLHYPFPLSILTTSLQGGGFVRLLRWAFGTHVRPAPMLPQKLPGLSMP